MMRAPAGPWRVGDVRIARVLESEGPWDGTILLPNATPENVERERDWLYPTFCDAAGRLRMSELPIAWFVPASPPFLVVGRYAPLRAAPPRATTSS